MSAPKFSRSFSVLLFVVCTALMGWLRLVVYSDQVIALTYGLPLLVCIWHRDRILLWAMAAAFGIIATAKAYLVLPDFEPLGLTLHILNILVIAAAVHVAANAHERLVAQREKLEETNADLLEREEEIRGQNEELQKQAEELHQQNEEIQQQAEELQEQTEELQSQSDALQQLNDELAKRHAMLETILGALQDPAPERVVPQRICHTLLDLFDGAVAAAILENQDGKLVPLAHAGLGENIQPIEHATSLAAVVAAHDRTAFVEDLRSRPDLAVPRPAKPLAPFRSLLVTPLRTPCGTIGSVEVYSDRPQAWTAQHFRIVEWAAAQCSLLVRLRRLHTELLRANSGLDQLVRERTAELQEMVNELEHFSYTITHDLRAPLRAMHGYSEMLADECATALEGDGRLYLDRISTSAIRMDRLITDALNFSKVVRHQMELTPQDPGALLAGMIDSYPAFQPPLARVRIKRPLPRLLANEAGLTQCFSNLLGNAVKFVPKGRVPEVTIRAESADGRVRIWFEDNGIGIAPEMHDRVFGMFQRLSKDYEGTGIGLALVKKTAERMQGRVGFESSPGHGSRFWLEFNAA
jgi:signal transduction histidine kinase